MKLHILTDEKLINNISHRIYFPSVGASFPMWPRERITKAANFIKVTNDNAYATIAYVINICSEDEPKYQIIICINVSDTSSGYAIYLPLKYSDLQEAINMLEQIQ